MHYTSIICRGHETKKQGCCVLARIPPALDAHLLGRSVRSVGKVAAVTQVTHNAQNNKGGEKRKNPENLESFSVSLSLSLSVPLTVGEGLAKQCAQVVSGEAPVGAVPLEASEPIDDLLLVEIRLHAGIVERGQMQVKYVEVNRRAHNVPSRCNTSCRAAGGSLPCS